MRLANDTAPSTVYNLLTHHWGLPSPNLVVSVVGGEGMVKVKTWVREVLRQGLVKASQSTGMDSLLRSPHIIPGFSPPPPLSPPLSSGCFFMDTIATSSLRWCAMARWQPSLCALIPPVPGVLIKVRDRGAQTDPLFTRGGHAPRHAPSCVCC